MFCCVASPLSHLQCSPAVQVGKRLLHDFLGRETNFLFHSYYQLRALACSMSLLLQT